MHGRIWTVSPPASHRADASVDLSDKASQIAICRSSQAPLRLTSDVVERQQANQNTSSIDHRQAAEAVVAHQLRRMLQLISLFTTNEFSRHCSTDAYIAECSALRVSCHADVAIGQEPDRPEINIYHWYSAAALLPHHSRGGIERIVRLASRDLAPHQSLNIHRNVLSVFKPSPCVIDEKASETYTCTRTRQCRAQTSFTFSTRAGKSAGRRFKCIRIPLR